MFSFCEEPWECLTFPTMKKYVTYYSFIKYYSKLYSKVCGVWVYAPLVACNDRVCLKAKKAICARRFEKLKELWPELSKKLSKVASSERKGRVIALFEEICVPNPLKCITRSVAARALGVTPNSLYMWLPDEFVDIGQVGIYRQALRALEEELLLMVDRKYVSASYIARKVDCIKIHFLRVVAALLSRYAEGVEKRNGVTYYYFSQPPGRGKSVKPKALLALCRVLNGNPQVYRLTLEEIVETVCAKDPAKCATPKDLLRLLRRQAGGQRYRGIRSKILRYYERVGQYYIYKPYKEKLETLVREIAEKKSGWACSKAIREVVKSWKEFVLAMAVAKSMAVEQKKRKRSGTCYKILLPLAVSR